MLVKYAAIEAAEKEKRDENDGDEDEIVDDDGPFYHNVKSYAKKLNGGKLQPPPPMPQKEAGVRSEPP